MEEEIEIKLSFKEKVLCFIGFIVGSISLIIRLIIAKIKYK